MSASFAAFTTGVVGQSVSSRSKVITSSVFLLARFVSVSDAPDDEEEGDVDGPTANVAIGRLEFLPSDLRARTHARGVKTTLDDALDDAVGGIVFGVTQCRDGECE